MRRLANILGLMLAMLLAAATAEPLLAGATSLRFDFETGDLQGWRIVEGQFDQFVCDRATFHHEAAPYNKQGRYFLSSLERSDGRPDDGMVGVVESPIFELTGPSLSLLVGGGSGADTYIALCTLDGKEVLKAHGQNAQPMRRIQWNVPQLVGRKVFLRLVDGATGSWGHITLDDFTAEGKVDLAATERRLAQRRPILNVLPEQVVSAEAAHSLRNAIQDLVTSFGERYPKGREYLERLATIESRIRGALDDQTAAEFLTLRREALLANPLVNGQPILFVARHQYARDHHNTATFFPAAEHEYNDGQYQGGGAIRVIDLANGSQVKTLIELPEGVARDPEIHFAGKKIVFSMRKDKRDSYHIYEMNADGSSLRQLTSMKDVDDLDPLYLPDESIVFSSTREPKYCACNRHIMANLFRMNADGSNIHQIGKSTLFEGHGALMPDGRILYYRWEYVDRNFGDAQGLWTCNPDGTNHVVYWGNNTPSPGGVADGRPIPGTEQVVCTFTSCHDRPWGAIAIIDPRLGLDGRAPVVRTWPADAVNLVRDPGTANNAWDTFMGLKLKYEDPYPLSEKYFLCSRMTGKGEQTGIFLIDVFGNEVLLHAEELGCFDPMPVTSRPRPQMVPSRRNFEGKDGYFYVQDVYEGTHMQGVKRGSVKYLRVVESPEKRFWTSPGWNGQGFEGPAMNWHDFGNKTILGTVPVEEDGSAYFAVPSEKFVYFQLLDENGMMIQSMRSGTMVQSGERASCVGCHEDRRSTPPAGAGLPLAVRREPSPLKGWLGQTRPFSYMRDVQPVFDKHCVSCHTQGQEAGRTLNLARDRGLAFNTSYAELWTKGQLSVAGGGPAQILQAYSWGSHPSKLVKTLRHGHYDVKLDRESLDRIITWVDLNAPYYPSYATAYPQHPYGRSPLSQAQVDRLGQLVGMKLEDPRLISFDRPELSPCLSQFADRNAPKYKEALALIRFGQESLAKSPGPDVDGFVACELDQWRDAKYIRRQQVEMLNRQAIRNGTKIFDSRQN